MHPLTFLTLLLIPIFNCQVVKLIEIYGTVVDGISYGATCDDKNSCLSYCYYGSTCILVYCPSEGKCTVFDYIRRPKSLKVEKSSKDERNIVYFKTISTSENCEKSYKDVKISVPSEANGSYSWEVTSDIWSFQGCRDGWKRFDRTDGVSVCMKGVLKNTNRVEGSDECLRLGAQLIGVASYEESLWMFDFIGSVKNQQNIYFWVDGQRNNSEIDGFEWSDGFTTGKAALGIDIAMLDGMAGGENCLTIRYSPQNVEKPLNDVSCTHNGGSGVSCGYRIF
ncbi:C-type lectin domain-containing protein [Caenorhabditis elegans]|uniref:C-type lectin domain-containing protein n=1 Tax=Caenorhabditis elegans TaxID=6239 RepID=O01701_CAEEL|nr:C-type lectin domain-containing protein [Caenorhabditis elegans]CAB06542.2 C-type lectin domain-containing protein [Caenorhabditis elegans]|eukprot:NP_493188.2 C-type LECtin [Caenorhabditis elegans]